MAVERRFASAFPPESAEVWETSDTFLSTNSAGLKVFLSWAVLFRFTRVLTRLLPDSGRESPSLISRRIWANVVKPKKGMQTACSGLARWLEEMGTTFVCSICAQVRDSSSKIDDTLTRTSRTPTA